jgi:hypothetical protein
MQSVMKREAELRTAVIDRLIAASLRDSTPAREASLERVRNAHAATANAESNQGA